MLEEIKFSELNENLAITLKNDWALVTAGSSENIKVTTPEDIIFAEGIWRKNR